MLRGVAWGNKQVVVVFMWGVGVSLERERRESIEKKETSMGCVLISRWNLTCFDENNKACYKAV